MNTVKAAAVIAVVAVLSLTSCNSRGPDQNGPSAASGTPVAVVLTDSGCTVTPAQVPPGMVTFEITSTGNGGVSELELLSSGRILAEKENIAPGLSGSFDITLKPGAYEVYCPGGSGQQTHQFIVAAADPSPSSPPTP